MTLKQIAALGRKLVLFLALFADCFGRRDARELLRVYVKGQLSDLKRKTAEGIGLQFGKAPRTLQRFLESVKWDEEKLRDRCQEIVAKDHAHPEAIGVVGAHLSYAAPGFECLLDSGLDIQRNGYPLVTPVTPTYSVLGYGVLSKESDGI